MDRHSAVLRLEGPRVVLTQDGPRLPCQLSGRDTSVRHAWPLPGQSHARRERKGLDTAKRPKSLAAWTVTTGPAPLKDRDALDFRLTGLSADPETSPPTPVPQVNPELGCEELPTPSHCPGQLGCNRGKSTKEQALRQLKWILRNIHPAKR